MGADKTSAFDILFSRYVPHLPEKIFFLLDLKSFRTCLTVNSEWNKLLMSELNQRRAASWYHEEAMREGEILLSRQIKISRITDGIKQFFINLFLALLFYMWNMLIFNWIVNNTEGATRGRHLEEELFTHVFAFILGIFCCHWKSLSDHQVAWDKLHTTETYREKFASVYSEGVLNKEDKLRRNKLHADLLKEEQRLRHHVLLEIMKYFLMALIVMFAVWMIIYFALIKLKVAKR